jgi:MarR family protease production transcriptional regulator HPr
MIKEKEILEKTNVVINMVRGLKCGTEETLRTMSNKLGLTYPGLRILWILQFETQMTITQLSKVGLWDVSTTQRIIANLKKDNLVEVKKSDEDNRIRLISLTDKSRERISKVYQYGKEHKSDPRMSCAIEKAMEIYDEEDFNTFIKIGMYLCQEMIGQEYVDWVYKSSEKIKNIKEKN